MHLRNLLTLLLATLCSAYSEAKDAVKLSQVKTLTLRHGRLTTGRRVDPLPQLTCVGGSAAGLYNVDVMQCRNSGAEYDAEDIQWTCTASLPPEFKLGSTEVVCEGYDSPDDPYVLKGSCAVEYRLLLTEMGQDKYGKHAWRKPDSSSSTKNGDTSNGWPDLPTILFWIIFVSVLGLIVYKMLFPGANDNGGGAGGRRNPPRGGGGGGGDGDDDPPPPYDPPPYTPRRAPAKPKTNTRSSSGSSSRSSRSQAGAWRPGPWTAAAAGAAAGYFMGNRNGSTSANNAQTQAGPSNWGGNYGTAQTQPQQPARPGGWDLGGDAGAGSSMPPPSSSRHESTGFGGTRRR